MIYIYIKLLFKEKVVVIFEACHVHTITGVKSLVIRDQVCDSVRRSLATIC